MALEDLLTRDDLPEDVREVIKKEIADRVHVEAALNERVERLYMFLDAASDSCWSRPDCWAHP